MAGKVGLGALAVYLILVGLPSVIATNISVPGWVSGGLALVAGLAIGAGVLQKK